MLVYNVSSSPTLSVLTLSVNKTSLSKSDKGRVNSNKLEFTIIPYYERSISSSIILNVKDIYIARILALCGILAPPTIIIVIIIAGLLTPGYSQLTDIISSLIGQDSAKLGLMTAGFIAYGVLIIGFSYGLYLRLQKGIKARIIWFTLAEELGITVVPVYLRFGDEVYRDRIDIGEDEFYHRLAHDPTHPSTTQPTPQDFANTYQKLSQEADGIVSIHISSILSGTYNTAVQGKKLAVSPWFQLSRNQYRPYFLAASTIALIFAGLALFKLVLEHKINPPSFPQTLIRSLQ
ncbi:DegV family protein [Chloroflexota bacterium]